MKILPLLIEELPRVKINRCLEEDGPASLAIDKLEPVKPMLESFAKANGVDLLVRKAVPNNTHKQPNYVKTITDNIISLTVRNRDGSNPQTTNFVVHPYKDDYTYQKTGKMKYRNSDGDEVELTTVHVYHDNFLRAFFRTFEDLTKLVKNKD